MHLGILTGGGDVPGLNAAINMVVHEAAKRNWRVTGFRRGWAGPLNYNPADPEGSAEWLMPLSVSSVRGIDRTGGTILHTSRTQPSKTRPKELPEFLKAFHPIAGGAGSVDCTDHVLSVLHALEIDVLVVIGGDDTLSYAARLHRDGAPTICIPKTMDNDVFGTDYCIGFSTGIARSVELIDRLRTPAGSHERFMVVEVFGRYSGETALRSGYLAGVDRTIISEVPVDLARLARLLSADREANPSRYAVVVVSEGATLEDERLVASGEADAYGHRKLGGIGLLIGDYLKEQTGVGVMNQSLAYLMRAGPPDAVDLMVAKSFATMAVRSIEEGRTGTMMAVNDGKYAILPADITVKGKRRVDVEAMYDRDAYRARIASFDNMPMLLR